MPATLVPVPPTSGPPVPVDRSPFWIGSGANCSLRSSAAGVAERHFSLVEKSGAIFLSPFPNAAAPRVDGRAIGGPVELTDGQIIELGPEARWELVTGAARVARPIAAPASSAPSPSQPPISTGSGRRVRKSRRRSNSPNGFPLWAIAALVALAVLVVIGGYVVVREIRNAGRSATDAPTSFTLQEGQLYDSLMVESTRSIERGSTLLDLGLSDAALEEFAKAIAVFEGSVLATNRFVRPTIDGLATTIQDIYKYNQLAAPSAFSRGSGRRIDLSKSLNARLEPQQFQTAVELVRLGFERRFNRPVEITGADHPEHVSLYGRGGAYDIRVRNLSSEQIAFLIKGFGSQGIRVKDFSNDAVLQRQIAAAIAAGLADRAGTGLHLHIDRFRDRRDRYTVTSGI